MQILFYYVMITWYKQYLIMLWLRDKNTILLRNWYEITCDCVKTRSRSPLKSWFVSRDSDSTSLMRLSVSKVKFGGADCAESSQMSIIGRSPPSVDCECRRVVASNVGLRLRDSFWWVIRVSFENTKLEASNLKLFRLRSWSFIVLETGQLVKSCFAWNNHKNSRKIIQPRSYS